MKRPDLRACVLVLAFCIGLPTPSAAQWSPAGVTVCGPPCVGQNPLVVSDGVGGCFVGWNDTRAGNLDYDVYLQHLDLNGLRVVGWPENGLPVCKAINSQGLWAMSADGFGGALLVWVDHRTDTTGIFASRIQGNGAIAPGWPVDGVRVMAHFRDDSPQLLADSLGGAYVAVRDFRTASGPSGRDIYVQHLDGSGHPAAGWGPDGKPVAIAPAHQEVFKSCRDHAGDLYFGWDQDGSATGNVHLQHLLASGDPAGGWPTSGKIIFGGLGVVGMVPRLGGVMLVVGTFGANSFLDEDFYTLGANGDGSIATQWTSGPKPMLIAPGDQRDMTIAPDALGGLYGTWTDNRNYNATAQDVYVQRIDINGDPSPGWPGNGIGTIIGQGFDYRGSTVADTYGGSYSVASVGTSFSDVWVAHLNGNGSVSPSWTPGGEPADSSPTFFDSSSPAIAADDRGGAFATFEQWFPSTASIGIKVQHLGRDAPVATLAALVAADAFSDHVSLDWFAAAGSVTNSTVERRSELGSWEALGTILADGTGHLRYDDRAVLQGTRYAYRLTYIVNGLPAHSSETWVNVPTLAHFALAGAIPNPAPGRNLRVTFSLPSWQPARLELYDLTGRRVSSRDVGALGAGEHSLRLDADSRIAPGMYWLRLSQGPQRATARVAVVE